MSTTLISKTPKILIHPLTETDANDKDKDVMVPTMDNIVNNVLQRLSDQTLFFLMINRSMNLVLYKTFMVFSWYFSEYLKINYTLFAIITVINFPGNILNIAIQRYYRKFRVRYIMIVLELILAASCLLILPWHTFTGLLVARIITGFAITAIRTEVNGTIGAFTFHERRMIINCNKWSNCLRCSYTATSISIIEWSFYLSAIGFVIVGIILQFLGWAILFVVYAVLIIIIAICSCRIIPTWYLQPQQTSVKKKYSYSKLKEILMHKRLQLVFVSVLLNKMARSAFYYTFSAWLANSYGLGPMEAGCVNICVVVGCWMGTSIVGYIVTECRLSIHLVCLLGAVMQVLSLIIEPIYVSVGQHMSLVGACFVIFFYFCGCQMFYNNALDIMIGVIPRSDSLSLVNTILLMYGAFGGIVGTIGCAVLYGIGGETLVATICAVCNVGVSCIIILLWIAHKRQPYLKSLIEEIKPKNTYDSTRTDDENMERIDVEQE